MHSRIRRPLAALATSAAALAVASSAQAQQVTIEYWQYFFESRVNAMERLIENFEAANPDINVEMTLSPMPITAPAPPSRSPRAKGRTSCSSSTAG